MVSTELYFSRFARVKGFKFVHNSSPLLTLGGEMPIIKMRIEKLSGKSPLRKWLHFAPNEYLLKLRKVIRSRSENFLPNQQDKALKGSTSASFDVLF